MDVDDDHYHGYGFFMERGCLGRYIDGFFTLFYLALLWMTLRQISGRWHTFLLRRKVLALQLYKKIKFSQLAQHRYWYRMKEFVIDLNEFKKFNWI